MLLFGTGFIKDFCQIFRPNLDKFWQKLGLIPGIMIPGNIQRVNRNKVSVNINKTASFHPALFLEHT